MILVDANVLVAMAIEGDNLHRPALDLMEALPAGQGVLPTVVAEAAYLIDRFGGAHAEAAFLRSLEDGALHLVELLTEDLVRMAELVERYASLRLGSTDASVVAVAERLGIDTVATFDGTAARSGDRLTCPCSSPKITRHQPYTTPADLTGLRRRRHGRRAVADRGQVRPRRPAT